MTLSLDLQITPEQMLEVITEPVSASKELASRLLNFGYTPMLEPFWAPSIQHPLTPQNTRLSAITLRNAVLNTLVDSKLFQALREQAKIEFTQLYPNNIIPPNLIEENIATSKYTMQTLLRDWENRKNKKAGVWFIPGEHGLLAISVKNEARALALLGSIIQCEPTEYPHITQCKDQLYIWVVMPTAFPDEHTSIHSWAYTNNISKDITLHSSKPIRLHPKQMHKIWKINKEDDQVSTHWVPCPEEIIPEVWNTTVPSRVITHTDDHRWFRLTQQRNQTQDYTLNENSTKFKKKQEDNVIAVSRIEQRLLDDQNNGLLTVENLTPTAWNCMTWIRRVCERENLELLPSLECAGKLWTSVLQVEAWTTQSWTSTYDIFVAHVRQEFLKTTERFNALKVIQDDSDEIASSQKFIEEDTYDEDESANIHEGQIQNPDEKKTRRKNKAEKVKKSKDKKERRRGFRKTEDNMDTINIEEPIIDEVQEESEGSEDSSTQRQE